ncbi:YveK family protein [Blastococcus sp. SYSU DS0753]
MEFSEYLAAIRRYWTTWVGVLAVCLVVAAVALQLVPRTYAATAQVFVSASPTISNSAQYVNQRAKSYPGLVASAPVLRPVIEELDLTESFTSLRDRVSAEVPADTSQLRVVVTGGDAEEAAEIANAVAEQVTELVPELEESRTGERPVTLTVSDPATVPTSPASPVPLFVLGLGALVGLFLGLAGAVLRAQADPSVRSPEDVRRAWGGDPAPEVLVQRSGRAARSQLTGSPARVLARRLEDAADAGPVRALFLSPSLDDRVSARTLAGEIAAVLRDRDVPTAVGTTAAAQKGAAGGVRVRLELADPLAPGRAWRAAARDGALVVLAVGVGRVDTAELAELRGVLTAAGIAPLAVALVPARGPATAGDEPAAPAAPVGADTVRVASPAGSAPGR